MKITTDFVFSPITIVLEYPADAARLRVLLAIANEELRKKKLTGVNHQQLIEFYQALEEVLYK